MNAKSYEARIAELENKVAVLTSQNKKNGAEEDLYIRIFKLENKVAQLTAMNEALLSLQVDVATLKSTKRKIDLDCMDDSPPKKRKLDSQPTFRDEAFNSNEAVEVYTDGSCFNNGRLDACAGIGVYWGPNSEDNLSESLPGRQTNNRAEIYAAIRAIEQAIKKNIKNLIVHTDSQFLINCITKWIKSWRKNGWVKSDGEKVINEEELQELDALLKDINVKWVHVSGHSGIPGNEAADKLAVKGAKGKEENNQNVTNNKFGKKQGKNEVFNSNEAVEVYTDGSCFNNGRHDACAGIGVYWGPDSEDNLSESLPGRQTNNRAEIYAAIRAIEQAIKKNIKNLIVHTDSQFLINCITKWIKSWRKNGWVKADGEKVINEEELQELDALLKDINVKWVHVDGHSGIPGNEAADKLAVKGAKGSQENKKNMKINKFGRKPRKSKKDLLQQKEEGWLNS